MKNCIDCGAEAFDEVVTCANCGRNFSFIGDSKRAAGPIQSMGPTVRERPDGSLLIGTGLACFVIALLLFLVAFGRDTGGYGPDGSLVARQWAFTLIAGGLFQLGLILCLAGIIVRAIWFLPGPEYKAVPHSNPVQAFEERVVTSPMPPADNGAVV